MVRVLYALCFLFWASENSCQLKSTYFASYKFKIFLLLMVLQPLAMLKDQLCHLFHCMQTTKKKNLSLTTLGSINREQSKTNTTVNLLYHIEAASCSYLNTWYGYQIKIRYQSAKKITEANSYLLSSVCLKQTVFQLRMEDHDSQHFLETGNNQNKKRKEKIKQDRNQIVWFSDD